MEMDTVDRIEHISRGFAVVLVALFGMQTLCDNVTDQFGPFGALAALLCIGLAWHARLVRGCLPQHPRVFVAIAAMCMALMTAAYLAAGAAHLSTPTAAFN